MTLAILRDAYAKSGSSLLVLLVLLLAVGLCDGTSMALLYPVLALVGMGPTVPGRSTVNATFNWLFGQFGLQPTIESASLILIAAVLIQGVLYTGQNWLFYDIQKKYVAAWQKTLFSDFVAADWLYCMSQKIGEMLNLISTEVPRLGAALFCIMQFIVTAIILCVYFAISLFLSWKLTLYLLGAGFVLIVLTRPIRSATRRLGEAYEPIAADLSSGLNEMLSGVKYIKASAGAARANSVVAGQIDRYCHNLIWAAFLPTTVRSIFEFGGILVILGVLIYGARVEQVSPAQLLVLIALVARLLPRLMQLQLLHNTFNLSAPAYPVLGLAHREFTEHREARRSGTVTELDQVLPADIHGESLTMCYGDKKVLDNIAFGLPAGHVVGFVGPSGAGKSTLVDIIIGLIEPTGGRITVGNVPLTDLDLIAWRKKIGYVSQDTFLFHDTIANNIRWSTPGASIDAVKAAARAAGIDTFVSALSRGYDTTVGDRGAKLSGGQRQRISIARALVRAPTLLILDEATSSLDSLSEQEIMAVINELRGKMTIVIIAHRLATVRNADTIYVLDDGRIVEHGSWLSLNRDKTLFHRLIQAQSVSTRG